MFQLRPTLLALGLLLCIPLPAQLSPPDSLRQVQLSAAQIVALRRETSLATAPKQSIGGAALRRLSALTLADALRHLAGVQMKDYGGLGGLKTIDVRAMGTQHTAVALDGLPIGTAQNGIVDLGRFSTDQMESLSLIQGTDSELGRTATQHAAAQVLQLSLRHPSWEATEHSHLEGRWRWASFSTYQPSVRWEQRLASQLSLTTHWEGLHTAGRYPFSYRTFTHDGRLAHDTTALRENSDVRWLRGEVALHGTQWHAQAYWYGSERGLPGAVVRGKFVHADRQWDSNAFVQGAWQHHDRHYHLHLRGKLSLDHLRYRSDPSRDAGVMWVDHRYVQRQAYLSMSHSYVRQGWRLEAASDYAHAHVEGNAAQFPNPSRHHLTQALALDYSTSRWRLQGSLVHTLLHDRTATATAAPTAQYLSPMLAWSHQRGAWTFRAYWKESLRLPTLSDLYYTLVGNAALQPERASQWNVGTTWNVGTWSLEADAYRNVVKDKIVAVPTNNQFRWTMQNLGRVKMLGLDLRVAGTLRLPYQSFLHLRGSYSYLLARDFTSPLTPYYGHQIAYAPRHAASGTARLVRKSAWLSYSFIYTGERYDQQTNIAANYAPPWYTSDLALGHSWPWASCQIQVQAEVSNLLDQRYDVVRGYPMPGRAFRLSTTFRW